MSERAFIGTADISDAATEWSRTNFMVRKIMAGMATTAIVKVVKASGLTVDVQPMVNQLDGSGNGVPHGIIHNMPVVRLQGGVCGVWIDPVAGDTGLAVFAHSDTSSVKATGKQGNPGSRRKFDWADGIYIGGILNAEPTTYIRMRPSGEINIVTTGPIRLNADGIIRLTSPAVQTSGALAAGNGATGTFTSQNGKTVTVIDGIVTRIV